MTADYTLYRGTDVRGVEYLLTVWADGAHELATRTPAERTWSPPVQMRGPLTPGYEPVTVPRQPEPEAVRG